MTFPTSPADGDAWKEGGEWFAYSSSATAWTRPARPATVIYAHEFGALGNGGFGSGMDCTTRFQAAITALQTAGGGVFVIPPGNWRITQPVKITGNNITVLGYGDASTIIMDEASANITATVPGGGWSSITPVPGTGEFRNSGLFQCWAGNLGAGNGDWTTSAAFSRLQFLNFRILGNSSTATFDNYQSAGVDFSNNSLDCVVDNVSFVNLRGFGAHARGNGERHTVVNCRATNVGNSLANHGTNNSVFANNRMVSCEGLEVSGQRIAVTGNVLQTCVGFAIGGNPSAIESGTTVTGNTISDASVGIYIGTGMSDCLVEGNTILRTSGFGINIGPGASSGPFHVSPHRTMIVGNMLRDIGALAGTGGTRHAIFVNDTTDVLIADNSVITHDSTNRYTDSGVCVTNNSDRAVIRGNTIDVRTTPTPGLGMSLSTSVDLTVEGNQLYGSQVTTSGTVTYRVSTGSSAVITPATITADQNDYAPTGYASASIIRVAGDQPFRAINGLAGGVDGQVKIFENVGSFPLQLRSQASGSTAAMRFAFVSDQRLDPNVCFGVRFDGTQSRWVASTPVTPDRFDPGSPVVLFDEFIAQSVESGEIGELGWSVATGSVLPVGATSLGSVLGVLRYTTNTTAASVNSMFLAQGAFNALVAQGDIDQMMYRVRTPSVAADFDIRVGWTTDLSTATPAGGVYFEKLSTDTTWFAVCRDSTSTQTRTAMATADTNFHTFLIRQTTPGSAVTFQIDRTAAAVTISANIPTTSTLVCPGVYISPTTTTARSFDIDTFSMRSVALPGRW